MLGTVVLAVASGFLLGIVVLAAGLGLGQARRRGALHVLGLVALLALFVGALLSGVAFIWLALVTQAPMLGAFALGAGLGAAVGVAVALVVGLTLVALLILRPPLRLTRAHGTHDTPSGYAPNAAPAHTPAYGPVGRRLAQW